MADYIINRDGAKSTITLNGDLTASMVAGLQAALKTELESGVKELVFDLGNTVMLDSSGIGLLIAASNSLAKAQGKIQVINVSPDILHLLQSMRLAGRLNATGR